MKKFLRVCSLLMVIVMVVGLVAACAQEGGGAAPAQGGGADAPAQGDGNADVADETAPQADAVDLVFWLTNEIHQWYFEPGANSWNETYADRPVNVAFEISPLAQMHTNLLISFQAGSGAPDLVDININHFTNFVGHDWLASLNRVVDPVREYFVASRFDIYTHEGTVYGLPTHVGATVVYYNRPLLEAVGIDIDSIITWEDFENAGHEYFAATGLPFTAIETANQRPFWPMIVQRGGDYTDADGNVTLDSDVNIEVLEQLYRWMHIYGFASTFPGGSTAVEETWAFINDGGIAALIMPMWYMSRFVGYMPDIYGDIYVRPLPRDGAHQSASVGIGGTGTSVTTQSNHIDLAVDVLAHMKLTPEGNIRLWTYANFDPPRWDVWYASELQQPLTYFGNEIVFETLFLMRDSIPSPHNTLLSPAAQDIVMNQVMFRALEQGIDARTVLEEAAAELRAQFGQ
ncbi:MAG: extracellular solute-binding protein [Oscillospiraceae bacterium]|nr:extracellular solute-binding protein [Oscillospiraceae bacterium]